ncbi:MAG: homoserine O-succinyltransferase [Paludibacteraceae bacterium]|nr:homoserine O-succinyltransferase [Candidatus Physcocola equi]MCQ2234302.1 homoserine O-succinyltransferase [Paludibacteraceae bacterium]
MPLNIPSELPAVSLLREENIFVKSTEEASAQDVRPLKIVILNLMPIKITTETDLIRLLSNTPLQIEVDLMQLESHQSTHTPVEHMMAFYKKFSELKKHKYDGMIITGAPLENFEYEEVDYWEEMKQVFDWARTNVYSTLYVCWGAFAGLYYYYGIPKLRLDEKCFGIFSHKVNDRHNPIFRGFDDEFFVPHSRHICLGKSDVEAVKDLTILSESDKAGVYMISARGGREFYLTGHPEYAPDTLHNEYMRDLGKGLPIAMPENYYVDNKVENGPKVTWRSHANLFYNNWINYFVYQLTPYDIEQVHG